MTDEAKRLYSMVLHEEIQERNNNGKLIFEILRVAGGWIYTKEEGTTFVKYSDEFAPDSKRVTYKPKEV